MKKLLLLALTLSLPLAQAVRADDNRDRGKKGRHNTDAEVADRGHVSAVRSTSQPVRQPLRQTGSNLQRRTVPTQHGINRNLNTTRVRPHVTTDVNSRNRNVDRGNTAITRRAHPHRNFDRNSFNVARSRVIRTHHNRNWWRSHFNTTFVLFGGGYYYWDAGYWYPAYGYDPYYSNYAYDGPIYGYDNLPPGQILENVQITLRDLGYYHGPIDGLIGPQTRDALARFQQDNGLVVTSAVDEPTLVTLGLA